MADVAREERSFSLFSKKTLALVILLVVVVFGVIGSYYFYSQYKNSNNTKNNPTTSAQEATQTLAAVGKLIELPTGEAPTIATVSDITKLKGQAFFANAKNGDKVLIYTNSKKAYLYRPSENKLIEVAAYNPPAQANVTPSVQNPTAAVSNVPTPSKVYKVVIYNGTLTSGLAAKTQTSLEQKSNEFSVVSKGDAAKSDYTQTLVIDLGGGKSVAADLAGFVNGKVGNLPSGEKSPSGADFLVILGTSK